MTRDKHQLFWEDTIQEILGNQNPCFICLVKVTCRKSFSDGSACKDLAKKLTKALEELTNENKT